nr:hypothetical protein GCM10025732_35460 [Glycomyces mayteni]
MELAEERGLLQVDRGRAGDGGLVVAGGLEQVVVGLDRLDVDPGGFEGGRVVEQQARVEVEGDAVDAAADGVDVELLRGDVGGVRGEHVAEVPQVVGEAADLGVVEEHAVGHVGAGDERVLELRVDVDGDVVDLDVGIFGVEVGDDALEDLEEVAGAVPDGDLAFGAVGGLEEARRAGFLVGGDVGSAGGQGGGPGGEGGGREQGASPEEMALHGTLPCVIFQRVQNLAPFADVANGRMGRMPATLRDVAELAQVSVRTVSNVVSGYAHVSERMRQRVLAAIEELDYRANPVARTLRTGRTGMLALVVPEIDVPYFSELARDVIDAAAEFGYRVMIDQTGHDHERERRLLMGDDRTMLFDGILFSPLVTKSELLDMHRSEHMPLVLLGEHEFDGRFDHVAIDNVQAARDAVSHLVAAGRTRIAAIGAQPWRSTRRRCCAPPDTKRPLRRRDSRRGRGTRPRRRTTAAPTGTRRRRRSWRSTRGPTRSSASPTSSRSARCARSSTPG